jgi:hypothetical protein
MAPSQENGPSAFTVGLGTTTSAMTSAMANHLSSLRDARDDRGNSETRELLALIHAPL